MTDTISIGNFNFSIFHLLAAVFTFNVLLFFALAIYYRAKNRRFRQDFTETTDADVEAQGRWFVVHYRVYGTPYEKKVPRDARSIQMFVLGKGQIKVRYDPNAPGKALIAGIEDKAYGRLEKRYMGLVVFDVLAAVFLWFFPALLQLVSAGQ